jgi:hypothetical protein
MAPFRRWFSDIKESKLFYKENVRFRGKYKMNQAVRENGKVPGVTNLEGITDVGLELKKRIK